MIKLILTAAVLASAATAGAQGFTLQKTNDKEAQALRQQVETEKMPEHLRPGSTQGLNEIYCMYVGDFKNNVGKTTTKDAVTGVLTAVLTKQVYTDHPSRVSEVEAAVRKGLNSSARVEMKDFGSEEEYRRFAASSAHKCILVTGSINGIKTKIDVREKDNSKGYYGYVEGNVTLTDITGNKEIGTWPINTSGSSWGTYGSPEYALNEAVRGVLTYFTKLSRTLLPVRGHILEKGLEKKDKLKQVYIDLGNDWGVRAGQHFNVYIIGQIAGRETKKEIGRLKAESVEGDGVSLCKVQKGADEIKEALGKGAQLAVESYD